MRKAIGAAVVVFMAFASVAFGACGRDVPAGAASRIVPTASIDQALFDSAVRAEVNFHRCRAGLRPMIAATAKLSTVALGHSRWMAATQSLSHRSTVAGRSSVASRIRSSGIAHRVGAENLGMVHRYQIDNRRFRILDARSCQFSGNDGRPLPAHSYASLARHVVQLWLESPAHRRNVMHRDLRRVSSAVAFDPNAAYCGRYWITQNFVG